MKKTATRGTEKKIGTRCSKKRTAARGKTKSATRGAHKKKRRNVFKECPEPLHHFF